MEPERLIEAQELARFLGVKTSWVKDRTRSRANGDNPLPHYRLGQGKGSYVRFRLSEIEEWLKGQHVRQGENKNNQRGTVAPLRIAK